MSYLEDENQKSSGLWDWVIGIGLIVLIGGGYLFYRYHKSSSLHDFDRADSLFHAGDYSAALAAYEGLRGAQYITPELDSILYSRLDSIEGMEEDASNLVAQMRQSLQAGDTARAKDLAQRHVPKGLLDSADAAWVRSLQ